MFTYVFAKVIMALAYCVTVAAIIFFIITGFHGQHPKLINPNTSKTKSSQVSSGTNNRSTNSIPDKSLGNGSKPSKSDKLSAISSSKQTSKLSNSASNSSSSTASSSTNKLANSGPGSDAFIGFLVASILGSLWHWRYSARKLY